MTVFTEQDMRAAAHESAHVAAAVLQGLRVDRVTIDREKIDGWGQCETSFRDDDPRSTTERAEVRAVIALAAVLWEPGTRSQSADKDVYTAYGMAKIAGANDADGWIRKRSDYASRMMKDPRFTAVADAISFELLERGEVSEERALYLSVEAQLA